MYMFFSQYEYDLYSIASLIVSANRLAMCTCIIIAVLIYHDVIMYFMYMYIHCENLVNMYLVY